MSRRQDLPFALPGADPAAVGPVPGSADGLPSPEGDLPQSGRPALHLVDALYERVREACGDCSALSEAELEEHARRIADVLARKARASQ